MNHHYATLCLLGLFFLLPPQSKKEKEVEPPKAIDITGYYHCTTTYELTQQDIDNGREEIKPTTTVVAIHKGYHDGYFMVWTTIEGTQRGAGTFSGKTLRVGISLSGMPGYGEYEVKSVNPLVLEGPWYAQPNGGKGREKLEYLRPIKPKE